MRKWFIFFGAMALSLPLPAPSTATAARRVCRNLTGEHGGLYFTFWKSSGEACLTLLDEGRYTTDYQLKPNENLVTGTGWRQGSTKRRIGYRADRFDAGTNSYLTLYGWSTDPLIEYYVVDSWGSRFVPPGEGVQDLGTVESDGGTYRLYRTTRVQQPSIRGTQTFDQYWSVRTERRAIGQAAVISFANHVAAWARHGMRLGRMNYQVMATEGFGSEGASDITVWDAGKR